jgi:hypothetical protein
MDTASRDDILFSTAAPNRGKKRKLLESKKKR